MKKLLPVRLDYLNAFIKTAQYLAGLTIQQDIWSESGKVLVNFFGADVCAFGKRRTDGEIEIHHRKFSNHLSEQTDFESEINEAIAEVLDSGFLTSRLVFSPEPLSVAFLPITQQNQITDVILVGHGMADPIPKELLNVYLAVCRLISTTAERLASEIELRNHRDHLDELVKDRTAALTKTNEQLQQEIAERKEAEKKLRESEAEKKAILHGMTAIVRFVNKDREIIWINKAGLASIEKSLDEVIGHKCFEFWGENANAPCENCPAEKVIKYKKPAQAIKHFPNGSVWDFRSEPVFDAHGNMVGMVELGNDITEKSRLETALRHSEKMDGIATLAGGVAHEFNNALMGIVANIDLLEMSLPQDENSDKCFVSMKRAGNRMSRLTTQLLAYAQGGKYQPEILNLIDFLEETVPILRHSLKPKIGVETVFSDHIPHINADYTQMQMVLSAILTNANEAMEDEGLIRITAESRDLKENFTKQHRDLNPGSYICITIEDNGKGMDEETRGGIFEPFFTTKFQGRGMGMAAVYGIVRNHDGWISVDSELGKGTVVRIYLPVAAVKIRDAEKPKIEPAKGTGTILLIEDEDVVVEVVQTMLEMLGYRVVVAKTGKEAIGLAQTFDGVIDLALLDIKLPDMEGGEIYPLIMKARPNIKVIVSSGYAIDGPAQTILDAGALEFLQKPFSLATLAEKLKMALKGK